MAWSGRIKMIFDSFIEDFLKNGLMWNLIDGKFEALSTDNIFELNGDWCDLELILLISYEICYEYVAENLLHLLIIFFFY